ncbi:MAG: hypothetical protein O3C63_01655 [Cyanobacteria bacterium]|nr:hypothetical protein [Cyanobacteriota bacterium]MDA1020016.1 hypothetical protein [Cyanobacteriota bacterium]
MLYIALISIAAICLVYISLREARDYSFAYRQALIIESAKTQSNKLAELEQELFSSLPHLSNYIGKGVVLKFVLPALFITVVSIVFIGPLLTNPGLGLLLGLIIAAAYLARLFYHNSSSFRSKLLSQLERVLMSIRNNLSTGMVLDYAVANTLKFNNEYPLGPKLAKFIKVSETNFIENFPLWLKSLEQNFRLRELARASQLLKLELTHTSNQEEAFINAAANIAERISLNQKQKNIIMITFFTMDFMVIAFLAVLFFVIPGISFNPNLSWWDSESRVFVVFISSLVIWSAYLLTVLITLWRQG